jgi:hypothetical protein
MHIGNSYWFLLRTCKSFAPLISRNCTSVCVCAEPQGEADGGGEEPAVLQRELRQAVTARLHAPGPELAPPAPLRRAGHARGAAPLPPLHAARPQPPRRRRAAAPQVRRL